MEMKELFGEKYNEAILQKQRSLNEYQLALQNLMEAFKKRTHINERSEFPDNMAQALQKLQDLQIKKTNLDTLTLNTTQINFTKGPSQTIEKTPTTSLDEPIKEKSKNPVTLQKEKEEKPKLKISIKNDAPLPSPWSSPLVKNKKKN